MTMLAKVRIIGLDLYQVEAFVMTDNGPKWMPLGRTKNEDLAMELWEYVKYYASKRWVARKIKNFEAAQRAAHDND